MEVTYFPGCSLQTTSIEFHESLLMVMTKIGISMQELPNWYCCGADMVQTQNKLLASSLPLLNLAQAERIGKDMIVPCVACYSILLESHHGIQAGHEGYQKANEKVAQSTGYGYSGTINVKHVLQFLSEPDILERLKSKSIGKLSHIRVAPYYGCLLKKTAGIIDIDEQEQPKKIEEILLASGISCVNWSYKTDCCGASLALHKANIVEKLATKLAQEAVRAGANAIVTICPLCQMNLDSRQQNKGKIPVFHITELLALALGEAEVNSKCFSRHIINPLTLVKGK